MIFNPFNESDWATIQECRAAIPVLRDYFQRCENCTLRMTEAVATLNKIATFFDAVAARFFHPDGRPISE